MRSSHPHPIRRIAPAVIVAAAATVATACTSASPPVAGTGKTAPATITIALPVAAPSQAPVYLASKLGYFQREGIDARIVVLPSDTTADAAMIAGSVQYTSVNAVALIAAAEKGVPVEDICTEYDGPEYALAVSPATLSGTHVTSGMPAGSLFRALHGVKVGIVGTAVSAPGLILTGLLKEAGLPPDWLSLIDIAQSGLAAAYSHGEVGAIFDDQPVPDQVTEQGGGQAVFDTDQLSALARVPWEGILGTKSYIEGNAKVDKAVCAAIAEADNYLLTNPGAASTALTGSFAGLSPALITRTITSRKWAPDAGMTAGAWSSAAAVMARLGLIRQPSPATLAGAYTTAYLPS